MKPRTDLFPNASESFKRLNPDLYPADGAGVCSAVEERDEREALDIPVSGEAEGCMVSEGRASIKFTIYTYPRPLDWDNYHIKGLQDVLIAAGILPDDSWDILEGSVESRKADSKEQERTEIEITFA